MRIRRSFYHWARKFPPFVVRLLAKHKFGNALTTEEIAVASQLPEYEVLKISQLQSWAGVDINTMQRFTHGCGLDLDDPASIQVKLRYLKGKLINGKRRAPCFEYLQKSPEWKSFYLPLIRKWVQLTAVDTARRD